MAVQTNGTLLDGRMLAALKRLGVKVGVSLDGDAEATGRTGATPTAATASTRSPMALTCCGRRSFEELLQRHPVHDRCRNDPVTTYEALLKFGPPALDLLLPHANWSSPAARARVRGLADQRLRALVHGAAAGDQNPPVQRAHPARPRPAGRGRRPRARCRAPWWWSTPMAPSSNSTRSAPPTPARPTPACTSCRAASTTRSTTRRRWPGRSAPTASRPQCLACPVMEICGGGLYPHRFRPGRASATPRSTAPTCSSSSPTSATGSRQTCAGSTGILATGTARSPRSAGCPAPPPAPRDAPASASARTCASTSASRRSAAAWSPAAASSQGEVGRRHQRVRVIVAECEAALAERLLAELDRLAKPAAGGEVGGVVDVRRQRERMPVTVDPDEPLPGLIVVRQRPVRATGDAEHGRQVHQHGVEKIVRGAGLQAQIMGLPGPVPRHRPDRRPRAWR